MVAHTDTFNADNLLTRGQEIEDEIDESKAIDIILKPGEFSLHHGYTFHCSWPNQSKDRRIGISINYVSTAMRFKSDIKPYARLVRGQDTYGFYKYIDPPRGILDPQDIVQLRKAKQLSEEYFYAGTDRRLATDSI